ncbi:peroxisome targeting signal receptor [Infundibulicybe gibba]|nr:peroxisome targeting signal receptor [Infundibulicybe gibba]
MSFQNLISGSECAVPFNPLSQVLKHTEGDRSLQQDRVAGPSSSRLHQLPGISSNAANEHDVALARQFFEATPQGYVPNIHAQMSHPAEFARMEPNSRPEAKNESWVMEQHESRTQAAWATEFGASGQPQNFNPMQEAGPRSEYQPQRSFVPSNMYGSSMPMGMYGGGMHQMGLNVAIDQGKGKGKSREADFEAAFAQVAASLTPQTETSRIVEVEDGITDIEEALKNISLKAEENEGEHGSDFRRVWDHLQNSDLPPPKEDLAKWEAEFNQLMTSQREDLDYGENVLGGATIKFDNEGIPILGEYTFERFNPHLGSPRSLLDDAKALLEENGSLSEAALLLEAAIQKGELGEGGYEAWILLGETRNMDEREEAGMRALAEGVRKAEESGAPVLAISFTNESYDRASHSMLLRWLRARFPAHPVPEETLKAMSTNSSWDTHNRITDVFLSLARNQHSQGVMDPEVQIGLGVLFYTNGEYDRAKDCFESALAARPRDYLLWNRLGSSLSNGSKPEEALGAYREALQIRPTYTRAIYNVGVACLNIGAHKEAAEHFLSALTLQEATSGDTSDQLWFTLRRAFLSMNRPDLADLAKPEAKSSLEVFRREGFDF